METYVAKYLVDNVHTARASFLASELLEAMAAFNSMYPEYKEKVVSWTGPTGIVFQMHDSKLSMTDMD